MILQKVHRGESMILSRTSSWLMDGLTMPKAEGLMGFNGWFIVVVGSAGQPLMVMISSLGPQSRCGLPAQQGAEAT